MIKIKLFFFIYCYFFFTVCEAANISVINIDKIITNNKSYIDILIKIELSQQKYLTRFENKEKELSNMLVEIENSSLLLNEEEKNLIINEYNLSLEKYNKLIDNYNSHYQNQIINIRKSILQEIIALVEIYAKDNKIDLVMDSTSYLIASNNINITSIIEEKLNNKTLNLEFEDFE